MANGFSRRRPPTPLTDSDRCSDNVLMPDDDTFPCVLTQDQLRFEIDFAIGQAGAATLAGVTAKSERRARIDRNFLTTTILARFDRMQVRGRAPLRSPADRSTSPQ